MPELACAVLASEKSLEPKCVRKVHCALPRDRNDVFVHISSVLSIGRLMQAIVAPQVQLTERTRFAVFSKPAANAGCAVPVTVPTPT